MQELDRFDSLVEIMSRLRGPDGCPWDREQTWRSLRGYLLEECHEALAALDQEDLDGLCEELGDLLFQIVFLSQLGAESGRFTIRDVVRGISEKMIRRHPHVFADERVADSDEVLRRWERIKEQEKPRRGGLLEGLPPTLPALARAQRLGEKAGRVGFDWRAAADVLDKVREEVGELERAVDAGDDEAARAELGDLLFATAMLARKLDHDAEAALESTNEKFRRRFAHMEKAAAESGLGLDERSLDELETLWAEAKRSEEDAAR